MRQNEPAVPHRQVAHDHVRIDVIEVAARRQRRVAHAGHLRRVLADEIGDVRHAIPLLQQPARAAHVVHPRGTAVEPGVVPVELGAPRCIHPGHAILPRLVDHHVQHQVIDAFAERPVAARFECGRRVLKRRPTREGLRRHNRLAIDVGAGGRRPTLDRAEIAGHPILAADAIRLGAILQKFPGETPVPVVFEPKLESVRRAGLAQPADVVDRHAIRHQPPHIPQETLAAVRTAHDAPGQYWEPRSRVVTVGLTEKHVEAVGPILRAGLVAVSHHPLQCATLRCRHAPKHLADEGGEVLVRHRTVHLVGLETFALGGRRVIEHAGRRHARVQENPLAGRYVPGQRAVGRDVGRQIAHARLSDHQGRFLRFGRRWPEVGIPQRQRRGMHLAQLFFDVGFQPGRRGKADLRQRRRRRLPAYRKAGEHDAILRCCDGGKGDRDRPARHGPNLGVHVRAVALEPPHQAKAPVGLLGEQFCVRAESLRAWDDLQRPRAEGGGKLYLHCERLGSAPGVARKSHESCGIAVDQPLRAINRGHTHQARAPGDGSVGVVRRGGKRVQRDWLEVGGRDPQPALPAARPGDARLGRNHVPHRPGRLDPRAARLAPAGAVEEPEIDAHPIGLAQRVADEFPPLFAQHLHPAGRLVVEKDVADQRLADPDVRHGLEIAGEPVAREVVADPIPVAPGFGLRRRPLPTGDERIGGGGGAGKSERDENEEEEPASDGGARHFVWAFFFAPGAGAAPGR